MADRPNLVAGDEQGNPLEDTEHLVNGNVGGLLTRDGEGNVTTANDEPLSVERADITDSETGQSGGIEYDGERGRLVVSKEV